jgi:5-methylcytosine-specific restriction endonuclease McrA
MEKVILLNSDYSFINVISWKRAVRLMVKGKAEVVAASNKVIRNAERTIELIIPKVLRLVKLIRSIYKTRVPFSKKNVMVRDDFTCAYCGKEDQRLTIDHIIPKSKGGKSTFENCVASCKPCNNRKNNRTPSEANMFLKKKPFQPTIMEFFIIKMKRLGVYEVLKDLGLY